MSIRLASESSLQHFSTVYFVMIGQKIITFMELIFQLNGTVLIRFNSN